MPAEIDATAMAELKRTLDFIKAQNRRQQEAEDAEERRNSRDGIPWYDAPIPSRFHRCYAHTTGWVGLIHQVQRCACGSIRNPGISRRWMERNSRRKEG